MQSVEKSLEKIIVRHSLVLNLAIFSLAGMVFFLPVKASAAILYEELPDNKVYDDFVVGPGKVDIELEPGESRTYQLTVSNRLGTDKFFSIGEEDFTGSSNPNQTIVLLGDDKGPYSLKDYVSLSTSSILIKHGTRARIPVTISVPEDAQPGGLYGSVIVGTMTRKGETAEEAGATPTSPIFTRVGTLFFVRVKGPVRESGKLTQFLISGGRSFIFNNNSVFFNILYQNDGNVHLNPHGTITVANMLGSPVGTLDIEPWFAMPNSLRFREVEWKPPFLFGRYVAHASIQRGYGSDVDEATIVFWVIPWKILTIVLVILVVVIMSLKWIFSTFTITTRRR